MYLGKMCEVGDRPTSIYETAVPIRTPPRCSPRSRCPTPTAARPSRRCSAARSPHRCTPPSGCRFRTRCPRGAERCAAEEPELREVDAGPLRRVPLPARRGRGARLRQGGDRRDHRSRRRRRRRRSRLDAAVARGTTVEARGEPAEHVVARCVDHGAVIGTLVHLVLRRRPLRHTPSAPRRRSGPGRRADRTPPARRAAAHPRAGCPPSSCAEAPATAVCRRGCGAITVDDDATELTKDLDRTDLVRDRRSSHGLGRQH